MNRQVKVHLIEGLMTLSIFLAGYYAKTRPIAMIVLMATYWCSYQILFKMIENR